MKKIIACFIIFCFTSSFIFPLKTASFADVKKEGTKKDADTKKTDAGAKKTETKKEETKKGIPSWKTVVAVFDFQGQAGVTKDQSDNVRKFIQEALVNTNLYRNAEREQVEKKGEAALTKEKVYQTSGCTEQSCAVELGKELNAEKVVYGTVSKSANAYIIEAKFVDVANAEIEYQKTVTVKFEESFKMKCQYIVESIVNKLVLLKKEPKEPEEKEPKGKKKSAFGGKTMYLLGAVVIGGLLALVGGGGGGGNGSGTGTTQTGPVPPLPPD